MTVCELSRLATLPSLPLLEQRFASNRTGSLRPIRQRHFGDLLMHLVNCAGVESGQGGVCLKNIQRLELTPRSAQPT